MKFLLFVEGDTERGAAPDFLRRWLDPQLPSRVGIKPVKFKGIHDYLEDVAQKTEVRLSEPDVIAAIGLVDLYGLPLDYPKTASSPGQKITHARDYITNLIPATLHERFRQHFAVHEIEAWLLSNVAIFPRNVQKHMQNIPQPESVDFDTPPASRLATWYRQAGRRKYSKTIQALNLFPKLDPSMAYAKCPNLKSMLDEMLGLAQAALT